MMFRAGEIWWCAVGVNLGAEIDGKNNNFERPVLVLKKYNKDLFLGVPMTSKRKNGSFFVGIKYDGKIGNVVVAQARTFAPNRLLRRMCKISDSQLKWILEKYFELLK